MNQNELHSGDPTAITSTKETVQDALSLTFQGQIQQVGEGAKAQRYIAWATAYAAALQLDPKMTYRVLFFPGPKTQMSTGEVVPADSDYMLPYLLLPDGSAMVYVEVIMHGRKCVAHLPHMDDKGNSSKKLDAREINDTTMRCLVKGLAMHGVGLNLYRKEKLSTFLLDEARSAGDAEAGSTSNDASAQKGDVSAPADQETGQAQASKLSPVEELYGLKAYNELADTVKASIKSFLSGKGTQYKQFNAYVDSMEANGQFTKLFAAAVRKAAVHHVSTVNPAILQAA